MDAQKLNLCMDLLSSEAGEGLIAAHIVSFDDAGPIVDAKRSDPASASLFCNWEIGLAQTLKQAGLPPSGRFHILELTSNVMMVFVPMGKYAYWMALDITKVKLGNFINVILPKLVDAFEEALIS
jgi:hypothetical protein